LKFDGVILVYGTHTDYLIATNFPFTTNDSITWEPLITSDISYELSGVDRKEAFTIKILRDKVPNLSSYLVNRVGPVTVHAVEIDTDTATWSEFYQGNVTKFKIDLHFVELEVESMVSLGLRSANRMRLSLGCIRTLDECGVAWDSYSASGIVAGISGRTISIDYTTRGSNFPDPVPNNFLKYGKLVAPTEVRSIVSNDAGSVVVRFATRDLSVGDVVTVYAGCDKSIATCRDKFNNLDNYLGFPHTPTESSTLRGRQGKTATGGKK